MPPQRVCSRCHRYILSGEMFQFNGETICLDCLFDDVSTSNDQTRACECCGEMVDADCLLPVNNGSLFYCDDCAVENACACFGCGERFTEDRCNNMTVIVNGERHSAIFCNDCYESGDLILFNSIRERQERAISSIFKKKSDIKDMINDAEGEL